MSAESLAPNVDDHSDSFDSIRQAFIGYLLHAGPVQQAECSFHLQELWAYGKAQCKVNCSGVDEGLHRGRHRKVRGELKADVNSSGGRGHLF